MAYDYWQYNTYGSMPWLARQLCMGEMCKRNSSISHGRSQHHKYELESPSYNKFCKLSTWKRIFGKPKESRASKSGRRMSDVDKEEKSYTVTI